MIRLLILIAVVVLVVMFTAGFTGCEEGFTIREGRVPYCGHAPTAPI